MLIRATADLHGYLPEIEPCDLLLVGGDVCPVSDHDLDFQRGWLTGPFSEWLAALSAGQTVGIAGNHDFIFESEPELAQTLPWTYLMDSEVEVGGLRIYGTPWVPGLPFFAFSADRDLPEERWEALPEGLHILLSHGPMAGYGDMVGPLFGGPKRVGSASLRRAVERARPGAMVCGHVHEAHGRYTHPALRHGVWNVAYVTDVYEPLNPVVELEIGRDR